jgi:hypothetical protein
MWTTVRGPHAQCGAERVSGRANDAFMSSARPSLPRWLLLAGLGLLWLLALVAGAGSVIWFGRGADGATSAADSAGDGSRTRPRWTATTEPH